MNNMMKTQASVLAVILILLMSCSNQKSEKEVESSDTLEAPIVHGEETENEKEKEPPIDYSIEGKWYDGGQTPVFIITKDSIFDQDDLSAARYEQEKEWAIFYYPDEEVHIKAYKTHPDTLIFESVSTKTKYWRHKNEQEVQ
jgi:hypothetical protein